MPTEIPCRHLRRTLVIQRVVQLLLFALLLYMAMHFQQLFATRGTPHIFRNSLLATLLLQLLLFFPLRRFATSEARRELAAAATDLTPDEQKRLRHQRLFADTVKGAIFLGFVMFVAVAPPATFVLSTAFFCFIVTLLTYLQCFSFALRRGFKTR